MAEWLEIITSRGLKERAEIRADIWINRQPHGTLHLVVDHASRREAGQGNTPTWLHWGEELGKYLRTNNLVGSWVTIESLSDGTYRLHIEAKPTGPFLR